MVNITWTDKYGDRPLEPLIDDIEVTLTFLEDNNVTNITYDKRTEVDFYLSENKVGKHQMYLWYKKGELLKVNENEDLPVLTTLNGPWRAENKNISLLLC